MINKVPIEFATTENNEETERVFKIYKKGLRKEFLIL